MDYLVKKLSSDLSQKVSHFKKDKLWLKNSYEQNMAFFRTSNAYMSTNCWLYEEIRLRLHTTYNQASRQYIWSGFKFSIPNVKGPFYMHPLKQTVYCLGYSLATLTFHTYARLCKLIIQAVWKWRLEKRDWSFLIISK